MEQMIIRFLFVLFFIVIFVVLFKEITNWIEERQRRKRLERFMQTELYQQMKEDFMKVHIEMGKAILPPMVELTKALAFVAEEMKNFMTDEEYEKFDIDAHLRADKEGVHIVESRSNEQEKEDDHNAR
ncbi:hypothetical protein ACHHV8_11110 [Paenibacillus sp. TAB 01]|uniref:hypothetical protein n=1 Tax=Paenibacillus sp. TAB 01 TaxID=3368988 RepID=UPI003752220B